MSSLQHREARRRAELLSVHRVGVELDVRDPTAFTSTTTIDFDCSKAGADTFVDFDGAELLHATLNGSPVDVAEWRDGRIPLRPQAQNRLVVAGRMSYSSDGEGLHQHHDATDGERYLYAMSFLDAAPRWFACFDQPDLKARYSLTVRTPAGWTVAGNAPAVEEAAGDGDARWEIGPTQPLSSYFVTLVAGPWATVSERHGDVTLSLHARRSLAEPLAREAADMLEVTRDCLDAYERLFGVGYPFGEEYHQAFVPDFNAGAMENPGCVTFREQFVFRGAATEGERAMRAGTIAHEMGHQWFGDLVTMRWWDDLWLNESFAEFLAEQVCSEATRYDLWPAFGSTRKDWGSEADQSPSTHPVAGNGAPDAEAALAQFDGISYAKGAAVLKQLHRYLGADAFFAGLRRYFADYAFANAALDDLVRCWEEVSGADLAAWVRDWLGTTGLDTLRVDTTGAHPVLHRTAPVGSPADRRHRITVSGLAVDGRPVAEHDVETTGDETTLPAPDRPVALWVPDSGDATWAKVRPTPAWAARGDAATPSLGDIDSLATRIVLVNALRDGVRNAEVDPALAFDLLLEQIPHEPHDLLVRSALTFARYELCGPYCPAEERPARTARLAATLTDLLETSEAGSDRQLGALRLLLGATADAAVLHSLLSDRRRLPGRPMDDELRWAATMRLVELGEDPAIIERRCADDPSTAGRAHAARCRAAAADPGAKARAWELVLRPSGLSAAEVYATAEGFFLPEQSALTAPFVPRYFAEINDTAGFRRGWALAATVEKLFPAPATDPDTGRRSADTLRRPDLHPAVRRTLTDADDRLQRAIRALDATGATPTAGG